LPMEWAVAVRSPYGGMIAQMPGDALRVWSPDDQPTGDTYHGMPV